jgi:hypothetical protein
MPVSHGGVMRELVIELRGCDLGEFKSRSHPSIRAAVGQPFRLLRLKPVDFPRGIQRGIDVRPYPHIGLATIIYRRTTAGICGASRDH